MKTLKIACIFILILMFAQPCFAQGAARTAEILSIDGNARLRPLGQKDWVAAEKGAILKQGDTVMTKKDSWMLLRIDEKGDAAFVELEENSKLLLSRLEKDDQAKTKRTLLDLPIGEILVKVEILPAESKFEVKTPASVAGVRGTEFSVKVEALR